MPIQTHCPNGHEVVANEHDAGLEVRCPVCQAVVFVPGLVPALPAEAASSPAAALPVAIPVGPAAPLAAASGGAASPRAALPVALPVTQAPSPPTAIRVESPPLSSRATQEIVEPSKISRFPDRGGDDVEPATFAYDERRIRKKGMKNRERWALTRLGLGFHYARILCFLIVITTTTFLLVLYPILSREGEPVVAVIGCLANVALALTPVLGLVGSLLCLWLPKKTGVARNLISVSFGLDAGALGGLVIGFLVTVAASGVNVGGLGGGTGALSAALLLILLGILAMFAAWILFMLFLRSLAWYLDDSASGDEAMHLMIWTISLSLVPPLIIWTLAFSIARTTRSPVAAGIVAYGCMLIWLVVYAKVLFKILELLATIRQKLPGRR
jgi:hypothetical protein